MLIQKKLSLKEKVCYCILFLIFNSSYNIMIKRVHDFNLIIPRTFLYFAEIIGPFTFLDIILIVFDFINFPYFINLITKYKLLFLFFIKDISIYVIGLLMYFFNEGYWMDSGSSFLSQTKGWVYSIGIIIFTFKYLKKNFNLFVPFAIILLNGFVSTILINAESLWVRYGHVVTIIDQEDAYTISIYIIIYLMIKTFNIKNGEFKIKPRWFIILAFFLFQNLWSVYKTNIISLLMAFVLFIYVNSRKKMLSFFTVGLPSLVLLFANELYSLFTSQSIQTRGSQLFDYLNSINGKISCYLFGSGISTPYYAPTSTNDLGEIRIIDLQNNLAGSYKTTIQTPFLIVFKDSGIIGLIIIIIFIIFVISKIIRCLKNLIINTPNDHKNEIFYEVITSGLFLAVMIFSQNYSMFGGTLPIPLFYSFMLCKFIIGLNTFSNNK